ncbi:MAG: FAD:protein FMN transferase [Desulfuromonadales bacterium]|nr:FAD:protein FMN transferase [Desulfuromonadales bacterium]
MRWYGLLLLSLLLLLPAACTRQAPEVLHLGGETMGTTWSVSLRPAEVKDSIALQAQLQARLDHINRLMSTYDPRSEISRFNQQLNRDWFAVSPPTAAVVALAQQISALTDGAFDISVGPLVELWGFGASPRGAQIPEVEQLRQALEQVGYQRLDLRLDPPALRKQVPRLRIDLSAVAKGYAVDALKALLKQQGVRNFIVEIGGELQISGERAGGKPWRIAVEKPQEEVRAVGKVLLLKDTALATSGNYRNFYVENGQRYAHTIDPKSGRPIQHRLASVTVLDPSCARADALATALMVLGEEQGRLLCEKAGIAALFLIHKGEAGLEEYASPSFAAALAGGQP